MEIAVCVFAVVVIVLLISNGTLLSKLQASRRELAAERHATELYRRELRSVVTQLAHPVESLIGGGERCRESNTAAPSSGSCRASRPALTGGASTGSV